MMIFCVTSLELLSWAISDSFVSPCVKLSFFELSSKISSFSLRFSIVVVFIYLLLKIVQKSLFSFFPLFDILAF